MAESGELAEVEISIGVGDGIELSATVCTMDVVETSGDGVSLLGGSPGGAIFPVQMRQFKSNK